MPNATLLLQPLASLLKISADFVLEKDQQNSFQQAKRALLNTVTLQYPFPTTQIQPNTEASGTHIGAALMQQEKKEQPLFPVAFYSKGLNSAQKKYSTFDRELLAAFLSVKKFRHFLEGRKFQLKTDHWSLIPSLLPEKTTMVIVGEV